MKEFLSQKGVEYEVRDVHSDESAQNELASLGLMGIPVTVVGESPPILGADLRKIETALAE